METETVPTVDPTDPTSTGMCAAKKDDHPCMKDDGHEGPHMSLGETIWEDAVGWIRKIITWIEGA